MHPLDLEVGKWMRRHAPEIKPVIVMNKSESLDASLAEVASEALVLGFGEPIAISAETGLGMTALYEVLRPPLEDYMVKVLNGKKPFLLRWVILVLQLVFICYIEPSFLDFVVLS